MTLGRMTVLLGIGLLAGQGAQAEPPYAPYAGAAQNEIYNLLYCDEPSAFKAQPGQRPTPWQVALFAEPPRIPALATLASDGSQEGRIRYLAYARLRALGQSVTPKLLLGVIVEVPLDEGLDVLAAFSDGGVRYINHSGKIGIHEGTGSLEPKVRALFAAAEPLVTRMQPWLEGRRPPPAVGSVRFTFLGSEGMYTGGGSMGDVQRNGLAAPLFQSATELLQAVAGLASK